MKLWFKQDQVLPWPTLWQVSLTCDAELAFEIVDHVSECLIHSQLDHPLHGHVGQDIAVDLIFQNDINSLFLRNPLIAKGIGHFLVATKLRCLCPSSDGIRRFLAPWGHSGAGGRSRVIHT